LNIGGTLLIDDIPIPAVVPIFRHMSMDPQWRLEGIFDDRAAAFTLLAPPASGDDWILQPYNAEYPDYSFEPIVRRVGLSAAYRFGRLRARVGSRYPRLRELWRRTATPPRRERKART
jgi:hypothetical protein